MEDIRLTALARYEASPDEVQQLASNIFKKLDKDEDGKVKVGEFLKFLEQGDYGGVEPSFFEEIGKDQHGLLDFQEAVVVVYVVKNKKVRKHQLVGLKHYHQINFFNFFGG